MATFGTIGVAIPCYKPHIPQLLRLLQSLNAQTRLPDQVVVSCSSTDAAAAAAAGVSPLRLPEAVAYPLEVLVHADRKNAAENRNLAAARLRTDYISFLDADDVMHPRRLEAIGQHLDCDIVMHAFHHIRRDGECEWRDYDAFEVLPNVLSRRWGGWVAAPAPHEVHNAHCTVRRDVWDRVRFNEAPEFERREDSEFSGSIVASPGVTTKFIANPLSKYYESGSWDLV